MGELIKREAVMDEIADALKRFPTENHLNDYGRGVKKGYQNVYGMIQSKTVVKQDETLNTLVSQVEQWGYEKELDKAESSKQMLKVMEEVGEVASALARGQEEELIDGIGDTVVTLIMICIQNGLSLQDCLQSAYDEIKNRKGKTVNGVFIKEVADLDKTE